MSFDALVTKSLLAPDSSWDSPCFLYVLFTQPSKLIVRLLDWSFSRLRRKPRIPKQSIRVVCIADTHCLTTPKIPPGDLLIHAGDLSNAGTPSEIQAQLNWLASLPHRYKVVIAGNHDSYLDPRSRKTLARNDQRATLTWPSSIHYLQHSSVTLPFHAGARELTIHGAPQVPTCGGPESAFQYPRGTDAWAETIPPDTDVLVTHTPPKYHLDLPWGLGCEHLLRELWNTRPTLHVFGHVHAGRTDLIGWLKGGKEVVYWDEGQMCLEHAMTREDGLIHGLFDPRGWFDVMAVFYHGFGALVWDRVWGGSSGSSSTIMVLASLMDDKTGRLKYDAQIVDI